MSASESKDGHVLSTLWAEYDRNNSADLPKKCLATLEKIKKEAVSKKLPYDFYDAAVAYVEVSTRRNWKLRDSLAAALTSEIESFGNPALIFHHMSGYLGSSASELWAFVDANRKALSSSHLDVYWNENAPYMYFYIPCGPILAGMIENDYEFALWTTYARAKNYWNEDSSAVYEALVKNVGSRYPLEAVLDYAKLDGSKDREARISALEGLMKKYKGKAAAMLFEENLLSERFSQMNDKEASSKEFRNFWEECRDFEKRRSAFSGDEKLVASACKKVKSLVYELESRELSLSVREDEVSVYFRNLDAAKLSLCDSDGKELRSFHVENKAGSFYVIDTVKVDMGPLDDGNYVFKAVRGDVDTETDYDKKTLSIAWRQGIKGNQIYVADYKTGKPLSKVKLGLYRDDKLVLSEESLPLDGFTYLPDSFAKYAKANPKTYLELECSDVDGSRIRKTRRISLNKYFFNGQNGSYVPSDGEYASLMLDCAAFHPGDEVRFKAVLYSGCGYRSFEVFPKGRSVEARLISPDGELVAKKTLKTSAMGSVASSFPLAGLSHNGYYTISIYYGSRCLASKNFDVDDFVLPTYEITFTPSEEPCVAGDVCRIKGAVKAYSGHNLSSARVSYSVTRWNEDIAGGELQLSRDGSFEIDLASSLEAGYYRVAVKVVDATGETLENSTFLSLARAFSLTLSVPDKADAGFEMAAGTDPLYDASVLTSPDARLIFDAVAARNTVPVDISYTVSRNGRTVLSGKTRPKEELTLSLKDEGVYIISCNAVYRTDDGRELKAEGKFPVVRMDRSSASVPFDCENIFLMEEDGPQDELSFRMGSASETWAIAELYDADGRFVASRKIHLAAGAMTTVTFPFSKDGRDAMAVSVFYFKNGRTYTWTREFHRPAASINPPLKFSRLDDRSLPGAEYTVTLQAWKGAESLVAVFDKSSETICPNTWYRTSLSTRTANAPYLNSSCGSAESNKYHHRLLYSNAERMLTKSVANCESMVCEDEFFSAEESMPVANSMAVAGAGDMAAAAEVSVREDFAEVLAFEPFLKAGEDGSVSFTFRTSDKLSTYVVSAYAHDKDMNNNVVRSEMTVTLPVKVSLVQPQILYAGDHYVVSGAVSSISGEKASGRLMLFAYDKGSYEGEPFAALVQDVTVGSGETASAEFPIDVPAIETLGLKLVFVSDTFSDAVFVTSPVKPRSQVLTEAHSGVLLDGMSADELLGRLRAEFTGTSSYGAEYYERNVYDMVLDAIPSRIDPSSQNVLSLSEALYVRKVASLLRAEAVSGKNLTDDEIISKILACRNSDGGFGWFEDMPSSPLITAVLLDRFHRMAGRDVLPESLDSVVGDAVRYIDESYFNMKKRPWWCGWLWLEQYLYVRSEFASVPFSQKLSRDFKKASRAFLFPKKSRVTASCYNKVRRASILARLLGEGGKDLAKAWGLGTYMGGKASASLESDLRSLSEYAVPHKNGGIYYPNMVSPYGGLLESQLYTHVSLLELLDMTGALPEVADGIRLWMLLLKETQQWDAEACYIDAIASILDGSEALKATKVIVLKKTYEKPLEEIVPAGNGMKIERAFFRVGSAGKKTELKEGDMLMVGDKILAEYRVWSEEYRSFVRISSPRPGCLVPVDQTSGRYGWMFSPIRTFSDGGIFSISPCGYRDSRFDRSEYWFDCFPEEKTTVTEEFYVNQKGTFALPALEVESLYAPHYRANSKTGTLSTSRP